MIDLLLDHNSNPIQSNIHGALPYQASIIHCTLNLTERLNGPIYGGIVSQIARAQQHLSEASVLQDAALVRAMELDEG